MALGMMVEGKWTASRDQEDSQGKFLRPETAFRNQITADGTSDYKAEPNRYHLYISWGLAPGHSEQPSCGNSRV